MVGIVLGGGATRKGVREGACVGLVFLYGYCGYE